MRKLALALVVGVSLSLFVASSANAERTFVFKNGEVGCQTDPGDVPGFGAFALPKATQVFRADGGGVLLKMPRLASRAGRPCRRSSSSSGSHATALPASAGSW